jgi:hypothetical protein
MKRRRKRIKAKSLLIISCIIALNVMGVSYSYWNDALFANATVTTGSMDMGIISNGGSNIVLAPGSMGELYYEVYNRSDFPVEYRGYESNINAFDAGLPTDGISIGYDAGEVDIAVSPDQPAGLYRFNFDLYYSQTNN